MDVRLSGLNLAGRFDAGRPPWELRAPLADSVRDPLTAPVDPATPTSPTFDEYVIWYSWAKSNLADDPIACHAAAAAATYALTTDSNRHAAALAAHNAVRDDVAMRKAGEAYGSPHRYVEWFTWARANLGLPDARCHEAAQAALQSIAAGGSQQGAVEAATRLLLPPAQRRPGNSLPSSQSAQPPASSGPVALPRPTAVRQPLSDKSRRTLTLIGICAIALFVVVVVAVAVATRTLVWGLVWAILGLTWRVVQTVVWTERASTWPAVGRWLRRTRTMPRLAVWGLALGSISILFDPAGLLPVTTGLIEVIEGTAALIGVLFSVLAIGFGAVTQRRITRAGGALDGRGTAMAAWICGAVGLSVPLGFFMEGVVIGFTTAPLH